MNLLNEETSKQRGKCLAYEVADQLFYALALLEIFSTKLFFIREGLAMYSIFPQPTMLFTMSTLDKGSNSGKPMVCICTVHVSE